MQQLVESYQQLTEEDAIMSSILQMRKTTSQGSEVI